MAVRSLPPFDATRDFIVDRQGWLCGGRRYNRGDAFRKLGITPRQMRLFYDQRIIRFADPSEAEKRGPIAVPVDTSHVALLQQQAKSAANAPAPLVVEHHVQGLIDGQTLATLKTNAETLGIDTTKLRTKRQLATAIVESGNGNT